jgi:hypothetical protein
MGFCLFGAICAILVSVVSVSAYNLEEYFPLDEGNSWTYAVSKEEKTREGNVNIFGKEIVNGIETVKMKYSEGKYSCVAFDNDGLKEYKNFEEGRYEVFDPPKLWLPNIGMGDVKEYSSSLVSYGESGEATGEGSETGRVQLKRIETVEVPAGRFSECLKFSLKRNGKENNEECGSSDCDTWLAPGVGKVKEVCVNSEYDTEAKKEESSIEVAELVSALVNGKKIGSQE